MPAAPVRRSPPKDAPMLFVMDALATINPVKDSTVAMIAAAANRGIGAYYMTIEDLFVEGGTALGRVRPLSLTGDKTSGNWCKTGDATQQPLTDFSCVWMRKDPPVDMRFLHACHMLEKAVANGANVQNDPSAMVALNEKLFAGYFPQLCPDTLVASDYEVLKAFHAKHGRIIFKPLDAMGGTGVFLIEADDVNFDVIWEVQTNRGAYPAMAQPFIPAITDGDVRIVVIGGRAYPHVLVRTPKDGSIRGNMAAGGSTHVRAISPAEQAICDVVGPELVARGIAFAGLDVIGDKLIEINITSPTGLVQIGKAAHEDVAALVIDAGL